MSFLKIMQISSKYVLTFFIFLILLNTAARAGTSDECPLDEIEYLNHNADYFENWKLNTYSQFTNKESLSAFFEEQRTHYCSGGPDIGKIAWISVKELAKAVLTGAVGYYVSNKLDGNRGTNVNSPENPAINAANANSPGDTAINTMKLMAFATTAATIATSSVSSIFKALEESTLSLDECLKKVHTNLKANSELLLEKHSPELQRKVKALDNTIGQMIFDKKGDTALKCLNRREELYLAIPPPGQILNVAQYGKVSDPELRSIIDERVEELVQSHPEELQEPIDLLIQSIRDNSIAKNGAQVQAYLYGPAGTGKSRLVKLIGETLGLHVCRVELGKLEHDELLGPPEEDALCRVENNKLLGKIGACFIEAGILNPIIFFDEAGEYMGDIRSDDWKKAMIQAAFKQVLDTDTKSLMLKGLGISVDTSRATYIFAGNYPITNKALLSRMNQIYFKDLSRAEKMVAAQLALNQSLDESSVLLSDKDFKFVKETSERYLEYILDEDEKRNPGARIIQSVVRELVGNLRLNLLRKQQGRKSKLDENSLKESILKSFSKREALIEDVKKDQSLSALTNTTLESRAALDESCD